MGGYNTTKPCVSSASIKISAYTSIQALYLNQLATIQRNTDQEFVYLCTHMEISYRVIDSEVCIAIGPSWPVMPNL